MKWIDRHLTPFVLKTLSTSPIVFLNGGRQVGKSTLAHGLLGKIGKKGKPADYISFDRPVQMASASASPESFLESFENTLVIDEVQLVPELFRPLKIKVDESRLSQKAAINGQYLLTGSANILALPGLSDALVGRMSVLTLYPFSTAEANNGEGTALERLFAMDFSNMNDRGINLVEAISSATFPEIYKKSEEEKNTWFDNYITTLLQRDVKMLADIEKISILPNLLHLMASRAGNLVNDSDLSRSLGMNSVTGKFYRNILKMMFLGMDVPPWYRNIGKRLVKSPKGYLVDTNMLCYLLGLKMKNMQIDKPHIFGNILENYVATELTKLIGFGQSGTKLFHFRTSDGKEIDFILEKSDGSLFAIEVKNRESITMDDFKNIRFFAEQVGKDFKGGIVLYGGKSPVPFGKMWAVPFHLLWQ